MAFAETVRAVARTRTVALSRARGITNLVRMVNTVHIPRTAWTAGVIRSI